MKAYEYDEAGRAKERELPTEGRDVLNRERERLIEVVAESDDALLENISSRARSMKQTFTEHRQSHCCQPPVPRLRCFKCDACRLANFA
jgi:translation elongation factor EF-G